MVELYTTEEIQDDIKGKNWANIQNGILSARAKIAFNEYHTKYGLIKDEKID
jgi:hypothetical protein